MREPIIVCDNLVKIYKVAELEVVALQGLDLRVQASEMLAIVGTSGSGKSTLMNILGGLDTPSAGHCFAASYNLTRLKDAQRLYYRRAMVGHIWQQSGRNLLPDMRIVDNVALPQLACHIALRQRRQHARDLLALVDLADKADNYPAQLSGGEQQRASIAVALANNPTILLADEPTGELDADTAAQIIAYFQTLNQQTGLTIIVVTHDSAVAAAMDRTITIRDGRTSTETTRRALPRYPTEAQQADRSIKIDLAETVHHEHIIIDRVGRLQLPPDLLTLLPFNGRAEVSLVADHIEIRPISPDPSDA